MIMKMDLCECVLTQPRECRSWSVKRALEHSKAAPIIHPKGVFRFPFIKGFLDISLLFCNKTISKLILGLYCLVVEWYWKTIL